MQRLLPRGALREAHQEHATSIPIRNGSDHHHMTGPEAARHIVAELHTTAAFLTDAVAQLERRQRRWKCGPLVELRQRLQVVQHLNGQDVLDRCAERVRAERRIVDGNVEAIVAHEDVHLEAVAGHRRTGDRERMTVVVALLGPPLAGQLTVAHNDVLVEAHGQVKGNAIDVAAAAGRP